MQHIKDHKKKYLGIVITLLFGVLSFVFLRKSVAPTETTETKREVRLAIVSSLSDKSENFPILGTVTSVSEAVIRSESSGKLTRVYKNLGDKVVAGELIASFENSGESASLLQAEGAYDAAKASRDIATLSGNNTTSGLQDTKNTALNTLGISFNSLDDAVRVKTDGSFTDAKTENCTLSLTVSDANLTYSLQDQRKQIEVILKKRGEKNRGVTTDGDLISELSAAEKEAQTIKSYLDDLAKAYSKAVPSQTFNQIAIDSGKALVSAARSETTGAISSLQGAKTALNTALTQKNIADKTAGNNAGSGTADANIKQALGAYNAAQSRYKKTLLRSPLSGTLNSLSIKTGDFVTAFTQVGVVSNNGALEIKAYVGEDDAKKTTIGESGLATSNNSQAKVIVTKVAEALDPVTKKIEVRLAFTDTKVSLINGETVAVSLESGNTKNSAATPSPIRIPLSALKMTPDGALAFTVENGKTKQIKVTEGAIFGESIEIKSGLSRDTAIVLDARGLRDGMDVSVINTK